MKTYNYNISQLAVALGQPSEMPISEANGQVQYGPPASWIGPPPSKSEVFVRGIPPTIEIQTIVTLFERIGKIYTVRLMKTFSGANRGYCFVRYCKIEDAITAILRLDRYQLLGNKIELKPSVDNHKLFVGKLPDSLNLYEIKTILYAHLNGIGSIEVPRDFRKTTRNFIFIEFHDHRLASLGRKYLVENSMTMWGTAVCVDWSIPGAVARNWSRDIKLCEKETFLF